MKNIFKTVLIAMVSLVFTGAFSGCHEADPEFVHTDNLITALYMSTTLQGTQYSFTIDEYNADGQLVTENITPGSVAGGYGIAHIEFPVSQMEEIDLTKVYLAANVTYDVIIKPGLSGTHDISGEGIVVTATGGDGKARKYRIYGNFTN